MERKTATIESIIAEKVEEYLKDFSSQYFTIGKDKCFFFVSSDKKYKSAVFAMYDGKNPPEIYQATFEKSKNPNQKILKSFVDFMNSPKKNELCYFDKLEFSEFLLFFEKKKHIDRMYEDFLSYFDNEKINIFLKKEKIKKVFNDVFDKSNYSVFLKNNFNYDVIKKIKFSEKFSYSDYLYFSEKNKNSKYRMQALNVYPMLSSYMAKSFSLRETIDKGKPLSKELVEYFDGKIDKKVINKFVNLEYFSDSNNISSILYLLNDIPIDWFPKDKKEWDYFYALAVNIIIPLKQLLNVDVNDLLQTNGGKWESFYNKCWEATIEKRWPLIYSESEIEFLKTVDHKKIKSAKPEEKEFQIQLVMQEIKKKIKSNIVLAETESFLRNLYFPNLNENMLKNYFYEIESFLKNFAERVLIPICSLYSNANSIKIYEIQKTTAFDLTYKIFFDKKNLPNILEINSAFQKNSEKIFNAMVDEREKERKKKEAFIQMSKIGFDPESIEFPSFCSVVKAPNDVYIVPMLNKQAFDDEGRGWSGKNPMNEDGTQGLSHCVAGSYQTAKTLKRFYFSFRVLTGKDSPSYKRLSTLEMEAIGHRDDTIKVNQHYGKGNTTISHESDVAFKWFSSAIKNNQIKVNFDGLTEYLMDINSNLDSVKILCGYEWKDPRKISNVLEPWRPLMNNQYRGLTPEDFSKLPILYPLHETIDSNLFGKLKI